ncbi:MAG: acetyl-CoA carboxylase carboxyl transferase subunit alpha [Clostridiales bacterium]|nr:acetyl-CoA carboxylase carboxyl transferase subunit alpha [Clostridiales bacterium]
MENTVKKAYDKVRLTRSSFRPTSSDYIKAIVDDFIELHGDRRFSDDPAVIGGIGTLCGTPVTVIGTEKGKDFNERVARNFGCALPDGYRKALRLVKEAEKFNRPVLFLVDIQGANPGKSAEERGIGEAIAENLYEFGSIKTPMLSLVIGEGGSGGALALSVADEIWMLSDAYYSVIAPESCASILFKEPSRAAEVAEYLKLTAQDLYEMGVVERIVDEPDFSKGVPDSFMNSLRDALAARLNELKKLNKKKLVAKRYEKFRKIGRYAEFAVR